MIGTTDMPKSLPDEDKPREQLLFEIRQLREEIERVAEFKPNAAFRSGPAELEHLHNIHRIHEAIRPDSDLDTLMNTVIDEVRQVFDVDQAVLIHPCVPDLRPRKIPYASTHADCPLPFELNEEFSVDQEVVDIHQAQLATRDPLTSYPDSASLLPGKVRKKSGARSALSVALHPDEGDPWLLTLHQCSFRRIWTTEEIRLLRAASRLITSALSNVLLRKNLEDSKKRLQNLSAQLFRAGEEDRKQFAREIHDDLGQPLVAIKVGLDNALYDLDDDAHTGLKRWLVSAAGLAKSLVDRVRMMQDAMYPAALQDFGPLLALDAFINNYKQIYPGLEVNKVILVKESDIPETLGTILFRIVQEALYNAAKHSGGDTVSVALEKRDGRLRLAVRDNGQGFDLTAIGPTPGSLTGLGLPSMQERTEITGGSFSIHSAPGKGTFIQIEWPLN